MKNRNKTQMASLFSKLQLETIRMKVQATARSKRNRIPPEKHYKVILANLVSVIYFIQVIVKLLPPGSKSATLTT